MKKTFKILSISLLAIFVMFALIPIIFKGKIVEIVKTEINNQIDAKVDFGEFDLSIFTYFPNLNFEINNLSVSGINSFEGDTLMYIKQFSAKVDLMSVMGDQIKVLAISLIEPNIYAHVLPDTSVNWDIAKASEETPVEETEDVNGESSAFSLALDEFSIRKANIIYKDESGDLLADIKNLDYTISGDFTSSTAKLNMGLLIEEITVNMEGVKYLNQSNIEYTADIDADLDQMKFDLLENQFRLNKLIISLNGYVQMNEDDSYNMDLSFNTNKNQFKDLLSLAPSVYTKDYDNIKTSGALKLGGFAKGTYSDNKLPAFNLNLNIDNASVQYPDLPTAITQIFVDLNIDNKDGIEDHTVIDLKRFDLNLAGNPFSARYLTKTPVSDPYIDGYVKGKIDFDKLKDVIPLDSMSVLGLMTIDLTMKGNLSTIEQENYEAFDAKGNIALEKFIYKADDLDYDVTVESASFEIAPKYFVLQNLDTKVGKSDFHSNGRIDNFMSFYFKDEILTGQFNLTSNFVDGNELSGSEEATETTETSSSSTDTAEVPMEVVELPRNVDFVLNTNIKKILYDTYKIDNFIGNVQLKEGVAILNPVKMNIIDGTMEMTGTYDSRDIKSPKIDFNFKMLNFDINRTIETFNTVQKLAPIAKNCNGKVSMIFELKATLDQQMEPIQETMNGKGNFISKNIVIGGSESLFKLSGLIKNDKKKEVDIKDINAEFKITDGNIIISPTNIKWNNSKATFGGKQGVDQSIDFTLNVDIPRSDLGGANKTIESLMAQGGKYTKNVNLGETINTDIFITGTIENPHFSLGVKDMANNVIDQVKDQIKEKVKEVIDKTKDEAIAEAKKQAAALMTEAEKQSQKLIAESKKQAAVIRSEGKKAAKQVNDEAGKQIDDLMKEAGSNPIAKVAAKKTGEKLKQEANKKAQRIEAEANKKADQLVLETQSQTKNIKSKAKAEGDKLIADAEKL